MPTPISDKDAKRIYNEWMQKMYGQPIPSSTYKPKTKEDKNNLCHKRMAEVIAFSKFAPI